MTALSPFARRLIAIGLLVLVIAVALKAIVVPIGSALARQRAAIAEQEDILERYRRAAARRAAVEAQLAALDQELRTADVFLASGTDSVVAAQLQNRVKAVIEESGAVMQTAQVLPVEDEGGFRRIGLRVRLTAGVNALNRSLHALEAGKPYLFLDNVDIGAQQIRKRGENDADTLFSALFDVFGYVRPV